MVAGFEAALQSVGDGAQRKHVEQQEQEKFHAANMGALQDDK
jgi:hypothetical protein